jgi:hypothetical protein
VTWIGQEHDALDLTTGRQMWVVRDWQMLQPLTLVGSGE